MRKPGLQVVFSVAAWPDLGRIPREDFDAIQHAVAEAVTVASGSTDGGSTRRTLRISGFDIECLHEPEAGLFTVERVLRRPTGGLPRGQ